VEDGAPVCEVRGSRENNENGLGNPEVIRTQWEAALAKLTIGGDEVNQYSYRTETNRRRWEPLCQLPHCNWKERRNHHIMISKQKLKYYDESTWVQFKGITTYSKGIN